MTCWANYSEMSTVKVLRGPVCFPFGGCIFTICKDCKINCLKLKINKNNHGKSPIIRKAVREIAASDTSLSGTRAPRI